MVDQAVGGAVSASTPGPPKPVDAQQLKVVKIAPDGDLILVVGTDEILILASSHCFRTASKSFVAILKPNFREGVDFSTRCVLMSENHQD